MPRLKKEVDSREFSGQTRTVNETVTDAGEVTLEAEPIEVVAGPNIDDYAEALKFNEDILTIVIHNDGSKLPEDPVSVGVNGKQCFIKRGQHTNIPRKYVERLLRAQSDAVGQDTLAITETDFNKLTISPTQRYPVSVLYDPNPNGKAWLQQITQQA